MDIKKEHNEARLKFQSRLTEITEPWKEIPTNEIPESLRNFAKYLLKMDEQLNTKKVFNDKTNLTLRKSEDLWLALLSRLWTGFFDTARCRYTEKFSKPRFQPKMA